MATKLDAVWSDDFVWAVVRLATYFAASALQPRLLFGSVSLLTPDRPRPNSSDGVERHRLGKRGTVYFRRTVLSARDALAWYCAAGPQGIPAPVPSVHSERLASDNTALQPSTFEDDPLWPSLGTPLGADLFADAGGSSDPAPFRGAGAPRIHRRFGDSNGFDAVIADATAIAFLKRRLHLNLADYREYLGSLVLAVPDPVLRRVQPILTPQDDGQRSERLTIRLTPRAGQSLEGLRLTLVERRSNLLSRLETVDVPADGLVTVESGLPFDSTGYAVWHPVHGIIAYQQPTPFIRSVRASIGVAGRRVKVTAPRTSSPRSPRDTYEVTEFAHDIPIAVGETREDAGVKVIEAELRRARKATARRYWQTWFDTGHREQALQFLRGRLAQARSSVMVADPYFGALQIYQILQAVPRTQIDFTILTSRLAFESPSSEADATEVDAERHPTTSPASMQEAERLDAFEHSLGELRGRGMKHIDALVLGGTTPPLHDRFLVIDDEVLFLGNSLNALGERASLILGVPDGEPILARLRAMAALAIPFNSYQAQRQALRAPKDAS